MADSRSSVLITAEELADRIAGESGLVLLDVSDDLETAPLERRVIPGAVAVSLASDFSGPATKLGGRRPLPDPGELQESLRRSGINDESFVVVYDNASGAQAGRAWWTLRWAGHDNVRLLDGGLAAWTAAGHATAAAPVHPAGTGGIPAFGAPGNATRRVAPLARCASIAARTPRLTGRAPRRMKQVTINDPWYYVGSWSAWTGDEARPVAKGAERG